MSMCVFVLLLTLFRSLGPAYTLSDTHADTGTGTVAGADTGAVTGVDAGAGRDTD